MDNSAENQDTKVNGATLFYAAAVAGMGVSLNTSWNFFGEILHVTSWDRGSMFFVLELAQLACGWGMRASIRKHGSPGPARLIAWTLCAVSAYMAWLLSGFWVGVARVIAGPLLSLVMLHLALGVEVRGLHLKETSTWLVVARELRQRFLATLGLSDEGRDAKTIIRDRELVKAIRIHMTGKNNKRTQRRFVRHLSKAEIMKDPEALSNFLSQMGLSSNAGRIFGLNFKMPFDVSDVVESDPESRENESENAPETSSQLPGESVESAPESSENAAETPVKMTLRHETKQAEIEVLVALLDQHDGNVSLKTAMTYLDKLSQATVARRLVDARKLYSQQNAS